LSGFDTIVSKKVDRTTGVGFLLPDLSVLV